MTVYISLFVFLALMVLISHDKTGNFRWSNYRLRIYQFSAVVLLVFACLRASSVGQDTHAYIKLFYRISGLRWDSLFLYSIISGYEIGYVIYNKILSLVFSSSQAVTVFNSLFFALVLYKFFEKYSVDPMLSLFLYFTFGFYQTSFNIVSNLIAALFVYSNLDSFINRHYFRSFLVLIVAFLFHRASLLLAILFLFERFELTPIKIVVIGIGAIFVAAFYSVFLPLFRFLVSSEYEGYLNDSRGDNGIILIFHLMIITYIFAFRILSQDIAVDDDTKNLINMENWLLLMEICAFIISLRVSKFSRVAYMFTPVLFVYIPQCINRISKYNNKVILKFSLIALVSLQYFIRVSINNIGSTIPYLFYLN